MMNVRYGYGYDGMADGYLLGEEGEGGTWEM
jgi:hypothetical protein